MESILILHNIRSIHNVASIFRTGDGAGVSKIFLTGYTPTPIDRFGRNIDAFKKVSLGAEKAVSWETREIHELLADLKRRSIQVIALEQSPSALPYTAVRPKGSFALIVGNEVGGVSEDVLQKADTIIDIPMRGGKESLNVAVATGIALYELTS